MTAKPENRFNPAARKYRSQNGVCANCYRPASEHAGEQCLFAPTKLTGMTLDAFLRDAENADSGEGVYVEPAVKYG